MGKTSGNRKEAELRYERLNHKIFCLYDAGRMDLALFMFPSKADFWKAAKKEGNEFVGARDYPVELLYPVTKTIPQKIPNNARVFTIPVSDIDDTDIAALIGFEAKGNVRGMLSYMQNYINENTTAEDYVHIMAKATKRVNTADGIKPQWQKAQKLKFDVLQPLVNEGLISSKKARTALDIEALIKDRKNISVLVLRHCPRELWGFLVHYFMNHIFKLLSGIGMEKRINVPVTIVLNEVADLLKNTNEDEGQSGAAISKLIEKICKQSRSARGLFLLMDTQLPQELPAIRNIMNRIYLYASSPTEVQKCMEIMGYKLGSGIFTQDHLTVIPSMPNGYYCLMDKEGVSLHKMVWTRSRTFMDGDDFYEIYNQVKGREAYQSISYILEELKQENLNSKRAWEYKKRMTEMEKAKKPSGIHQESFIEDDEEEVELKQKVPPKPKEKQAKKPKAEPTPVIPSVPEPPTPPTMALNGAQAPLPPEDEPLLTQGLETEDEPANPATPPAEIQTPVDIEPEPEGEEDSGDEGEGHDSEDMQDDEEDELKDDEHPPAINDPSEDSFVGSPIDENGEIDWDAGNNLLDNL